MLRDGPGRSLLGEEWREWLHPGQMGKVMPTGHADVWTARVWLLRLAFGHPGDLTDMRETAGRCESGGSPEYSSGGDKADYWASHMDGGGEHEGTATLCVTHQGLEDKLQSNRWVA